MNSLRSCLVYHTFALLWFLAQAGSVSAQVMKVLEVPDGIRMVALAAGTIPDFEGSRQTMFGVAPLVRYPLSYGRFLLLSGNELSANLSGHPGWRMGPVARYRFGRGSNVQDDVVKQMRPIKGTLEAGGFIGYVLPLGTDPRAQFSWSVDGLADLGGVSEGGVVSARVNLMVPIHMAIIGFAGASVRFGDARFNTTYFGITGEDVHLFPSRLGADYSPRGGLMDFRLVAGAIIHLSRKWHLLGGASLQRFQGGISGSPLIRERGTANQWITGAGGGYVF